MTDAFRHIDPEELLREATWVRRLAERLLVDPDQVDEVVQQTWLTALRRRSRPPRSLRAWLGGVLRNTIHHERRGNERRRRREHAAAVDEATPSAAELAAQADMHRSAVTAVLELSEPYRSTVLRHFFHGMTPQEIAQQEGVPSSTVRSRLRRALAQLRTRLDQSTGGRETWSAALLPLAFVERSLHAKAATAGSTNTLARILGMTAKAKAWTIIAIVVLAGATLWLQHPEDRDNHEGNTSASMPAQHADSEVATPALNRFQSGAEDAMPVAVQVAHEDLHQTDGNAQFGKRIVLSGRVLDDLGHPVMAATVWHWPSPAMRKHLELPRATRHERVPFELLVAGTTDNEGRFALETRDMASTPASRRETWTAPAPALIVEHADYAALSYTCARFDGGDHDVGDLVLSRGGGLSGRVVDEEGRPLAGVIVGPAEGSQEPFGAKREDWALVSWLMRAETALDGRFHLGHVWPGTKLQYVALGEGYSPRLFYPTVEEGADLNVGDLALSRGATISGQVVDADGHPLRGVTARARWAKLNFTPPGDDTVLHEVSIQVWSVGVPSVERETDQDGIFVLDTLNQDRYRITLQRDGYEPVRRTDVEPGTESLHVVMQQEAEALVHVLDAETGDPISGATGTARRRASSEPHSSDPVLQVLAGAGAARAAGVDDDGEGLLLIRSIGPIMNELVVEAEGYATSGILVPGVPAPARTDITVKLPRASQLTGRVVDEAGKLMVGASVKLHPPAPEGMRLPGPATETDRDGRFAFDRLVQGRWIMSSEVAGFLPSEARDIDIPEGRRRDLGDLVLRKGASVAGTVLRPDGTPFAGTFVSARLEAQPGLSWTETTTDGGGQFLFDALREGRWILTSDPGDEAIVDLVSGEHAEVTLYQRGRPIIRGRVTYAGMPVENAVVGVDRGRNTSDFETGHWTTTTDVVGEYELQVGRPGTRVLRAQHAGAWSSPVPVTAYWDSIEVVDLSFGTGRISGVVNDVTTGEPLETIVVMLELDDGGNPRRTDARWSAWTDTRGLFAFERVPAGQYHLENRHGSYLGDPVGPFVIGPGTVIEDVRIEAVPGATLVIQLLNADGSPAEGDYLARLKRTDEDEYPRSTHGPSHPGRFKLGGLHPGGWQVRIERRPSRLGFDAVSSLIEREVTLTSGEERELILTLPWEG